MSLPVIIAVNLTAGDIFLERVGLTVPASGSLTLTDYAYVHEIKNDSSIYQAISDDEILLSFDDYELSKAESLKFFTVVTLETRIPVRVVYSSNDDLTGLGTFDGVSLSAGDRILLTGQSTPSENGIWIASSGAWSRPLDFAVGDSAAGAQIVVLEGTYAGQVWICANDIGSDVIGTSNLSFDVGSGGLITLQIAYDNGTGGDGVAGAITTNSTDGKILIAGSEKLQITATSGLDVDTIADFDVSTFDVQMTGSNGFSIDGTAASNLSTTGANLTLSTISSGILAVTSAGALNLSSTTGDWQATGALTIDSSGGAISIGADADAQAINIGTGSSARTITLGNSTSTTSMSLNVGTGGLNLGTNATAHTTTVGSTTSTSAVTLQTGTGAYTVNAGGIYDINATGAVTIDGPGISIDGTSASNLSTTGANLTISTISSGTLAITSAGALNLSSTTGDWQSTGALTIDSSGGAISIGSDADAQAINIGTGAAARTITLGNSTSTTGLVLTSGSEKIRINGITYYGVSAGNPTARAGGFQNGDEYFDSNLGMRMVYDSSRTKWLSVEATTFYFGRNNNTPAGSYYRTIDGLVMSSTIGYVTRYNCTLTEIGITRANTTATVFEVVDDGSSAATLSTSAAKDGSHTLNVNIAADSVISVRNQSGAGTTNDVSGWVKIRFRA